MADEVHEQYADTLSPPIALFITLFLMHALEAIVPRTGTTSIILFGGPACRDGRGSSVILATATEWIV